LVVTTFLTLFNILNPQSPESSTLSVFVSAAVCTLIPHFPRVPTTKMYYSDPSVSRSIKTTRTGLRDIPQNVPRSWKKKPFPLQCFCKEEPPSP